MGGYRLKLTIQYLDTVDIFISVAKQLKHFFKKRKKKYMTLHCLHWENLIVARSTSTSVVVSAPSLLQT